MPRRQRTHAEGPFPSVSQKEAQQDMKTPAICQLLLLFACEIFLSLSRRKPFASRTAGLSLPYPHPPCFSGLRLGGSHIHKQPHLSQFPLPLAPPLSLAHFHVGSTSASKRHANGPQKRTLLSAPLLSLHLPSPPSIRLPTQLDRIRCQSFAYAHAGSVIWTQNLAPPLPSTPLQYSIQSKESHSPPA